MKTSSKLQWGLYIFFFVVALPKIEREIHSIPPRLAQIRESSTSDIVKILSRSHFYLEVDLENVRIKGE
jgi:hypothetical protein